jgi:hypothetical protein
VKRLIVGIVILVVCVGMVVYSRDRSHEVYAEDVPADEFAFYDEISETTLILDSTFTGVIRSATTGNLITNYDRDDPEAKPACPT